MKTKLILFLLCLFTLSAVSETGPKREKCTTCGKLKANCPYHGNHPKKPEPKPETACKSCGKPVSKCPHKGNHPKPEATCKSCKKPLSKCQYKGKHPTTGTLNGHEWVDLGLPSGTKWATTNVGASSPSDYGDYFAWGETSPKSSYTWDNLKYCLDSTDDKFSKYVTNSKYGNVDGKSELDPSDDAAYVNWGSGWRMPSKTQQDELREKCNWTWTTMGGNNGYKVVGPNGNSLFLPAAGCRYGSDFDSDGSYGSYWSRSLFLGSQWGAYGLYFDSGDVDWSNIGRRNGRCVRPVLGS